VTRHVDEGSPIRHQLGVLRRGLWIILLTAGLAAAAAVYLSLRQQPLYQSSAEVFLNNQNLAASLSNVSLPYVDPTRAAETQAALARLPAVADRAIADSGLQGRSAAELLGSSSVAPSSNADLLTFSVNDRSPRIAAQLATSYARAYTSYRRAIDTANLIKARQGIEQQINQLAAEGQHNSTVYLDLLSRDQQLRTMELLQGSAAQLVRPAAGAAKVQPRPTRNGVLAFVLGLTLGIGLAYLRSALDTRVRSPSEVEGRLGLPLLGRIPEPPRRLRSRDALVMLEAPQSAGGEAFRILATNIELMNIDRQARTIMFTSALGGEGKSTTVANLAVAFARSGRRVALVDMDMRRPSLDRYLMPGGGPKVGAPGLTQVLLGRSTLDDALVPVPILDHTGSKSGNGSIGGLLELFTAGPALSSPSEFFGSQALTELLAQLEKRADLVLIDAPPLLHVSDTIALSARVDALVAIINLDKVRRPVLNELHRVLETAPVVKLGFVLTGTKAEDVYGYSGDYSYREPTVEQPSREGVR
jgi:capsular exopolysaccharide synthesis family protein